MHKAKIFMNGQSQAVRIPKEYRFASKEVSVTTLGNGIVLQPILKTWQDVFNELKPTDDFLVDGIEDLPPQERNWGALK